VKKKHRVLLVGWDGADWQVARPLMNQGHMPQLKNIVDHGASGNLASFAPYLSPMLWNTIATGKWPHKHGICGFSEVSEETGNVRPVSSTSRQSKAIWNILTEHGRKCHILGWFASHPAEPINGICVSEAFARPSGKVDAQWSLPKASVYPPEQASELKDIRVAPEDVDKRLLDFLVPRHREIKGAPQRRLLDQLMIRLSELYTIHNAAIKVIQHDGDFELLGVYYHFLDWICHDFMKFHPPKEEHIQQEHYDVFRDVVSNAYRLQDLLLQDLLNQSGPGTTVMVISDHGFKSDHLRPKRTPNVTAGIASWHRRYGILAAAGPGIKKSAAITGASLADITPSLLHYLNLPVGNDMDGRVLSNLFPQQRKVERIDSWETLAPIAPMPPIYDTGWDATDEAQLLNQFQQLGYIDEIAPDANLAAIQTRSNNAWNLGVMLRTLGLKNKALPYLEEAYFNAPEQIATANQLAQCQISLGLYDAAEETVQTIMDLGDTLPTANLLMAQVEHQRGNYEVAWTYLERAEAQEEHSQQLFLRKGFTLLALNEFEAADHAFQKALAHDPDEPRAYLGRAHTLYYMQHYDEALDSARQAILLEHDLLKAYVIFGIISECRKEWKLAEEAYRCVLSIDPGHRGAFLRVSDLAARKGSNYTENALKTEQQFNQLIQTKRKPNAAIQTLQDESNKRISVLWDQRTRMREQSRPITTRYPKNWKLRGSSGKTFIIVSGLPRSGTSLMMQILSAGGMEVMTDGKRSADQHNPKGYFEWEAIKGLKNHPERLDLAEGKAIKVISMLIPYIPSKHRYKVIFMERALAEVAASQMQMLKEEKNESGMGKDPHAVELLRRHKDKIITLLENAPNIECLRVDYADLINSENSKISDKIIRFIGKMRLPQSQEMMKVIDKQCYRQKSDSKSATNQPV
jgi:predicted AlkP superfamily phosphohydrolase/phosphomutase/tetratricopeptide (TPR) repeat protein